MNSKTPKKIFKQNSSQRTDFTSGPREVAYSYVSTNIKNGTWKNGDRIPVGKVLAKKVGVSHKIMFEALNRLRQEGSIVFKKKTGIFVGHSIPEKPQPVFSDVQPLKWQRIEKQLLTDLLEGRFINNVSLPTIKELGSIYNVGTRVLRKAISSLILKGFLVEGKREIQIKHLSRVQSINTIILFVDIVEISREFWAFGKIMLDLFIKTLEHECVKLNINLVHSPIPQDISKITSTQINVIGYIVIIHLGMEQNSAFINQLGASKKPVFWYSLNTADLQYLQYPEFMFCRQNDHKAGLEIGRYLYEKGHRKVCFIGFQKKSYPLERFLGLQAAFELFGIQENVVPLFLSDISEALISDENNKLRENTQQLFDVEKKHILNFFPELEFSEGSAIAPLPKELEYLRVLYPTEKKTKINFLVEYLARFLGSLKELKNLPLVRRISVPLLERALEHTDATAWVCADDNIANFAALDFCHERGIAIPGKIAIVGFEDFPESYTNNLTTYRFDVIKASYHALNFILYPKTVKKEMKGAGEYRLDGRIIDRGSV